MSQTLHSLQSILRAVERESEALVLEPGRHGYDDARRIFNRAIDRRPAAVVRPRRSDDVPIVVRRLTEGGVPFTVKGGGHHVAGTCVADGAVMLDMSLLRRVTFDRSTDVATVEAGALWCDYDAVTVRHGVASTGGIVSHTGVAGLTLGGGLGWLMGEFGLACDALVGVSALNSACELCRIDEGDPALRWFRGAGRSLGVVTQFRFRPQPIPPKVSAGRITAALDEAPSLMKACARACWDSPDWLTVSPSLMWLSGKWSAVLDFVSTKGPAETIEALSEGYGYRPQHIAEVSYIDAQKQLDSALRFGRRNYWKSKAVSDIDVDKVYELGLHLTKAPSKQTFVSVDVLHGRALQEPPGGASYRLRNRPLVVLINTIWEMPEADQRNLEWCGHGFSLIPDPAGESATYSNYFSRDDVGTQAGSELPLDPGVLDYWRPPTLR